MDEPKLLEQKELADNMSRDSSASEHLRKYCHKRFMDIFTKLCNSVTQYEKDINSLNAQLRHEGRESFCRQLFNCGGNYSDPLNMPEAIEISMDCPVIELATEVEKLVKEHQELTLLCSKYKESRLCEVTCQHDRTKHATIFVQTEPIPVGANEISCPLCGSPIPSLNISDAKIHSDCERSKTVPYVVKESPTISFSDITEKPIVMKCLDVVDFQEMDDYGALEAESTGSSSSGTSEESNNIIEENLDDTKEPNYDDSKEVNTNSSKVPNGDEFVEKNSEEFALLVKEQNKKIDALEKLLVIKERECAQLIEALKYKY